jgi:hypothetical protein
VVQLVGTACRLGCRTEPALRSAACGLPKDPYRSADAQVYCYIEVRQIKLAAQLVAVAAFQYRFG